MNEKVILKELADGSESSMKVIYDEYFVLLCQIAHIKLKDQNLVRDMVQDLMMNIWKRRETLEVKGSLKAYLIKSLHYKISRTNQYLKPTVALQDNIEKPNNETNELEYNELKNRVNLIIDQMPARVKECFLLSRIDGLKYKEIALKLDISPKTVEHHISKALKTLKENLKNHI